jgi:hypothetical protein
MNDGPVGEGFLGRQHMALPRQSLPPYTTPRAFTDKRPCSCHALAACCTSLEFGIFHNPTGNIFDKNTLKNILLGYVFREVQNELKRGKIKE